MYSGVIYSKVYYLRHHGVGGSRSTDLGTAEAAEKSVPASGFADLNKKEALGVFADQHLAVDEEGTVPKADVYSAYESWADDLGVEAVTNSGFTRRLKGYITFEITLRRKDGDIVRYFVGFTLDQEEDTK